MNPFLTHPMKLTSIRRLLAAAFLSLAVTAAAQVPNILNYQGRIAVRGVNFDGTGQFKFALVDGGTTTMPETRTATGTAVVTSGFVTSINLTDGGAGYTSAPVVNITGGGGSGAAATATMSGGAVTGLTITSPGSGYGSAPTVTIASPPAASPTTAYVTYWSNDGTSVAGSEPTAAISLPVSKGLFSVGLGDNSLVHNESLNPNVFDNPDLRLRIWFNDGTRGWQKLSPDSRITPVAKAYSSAVRSKTYSVPFNFFVAGSGETSRGASIDGKSFLLPLTVNGDGHGASGYGLHPIPQNCESILAITASVEANNNGTTVNGPGGGKAGVRIWSKSSSSWQMIAESIVDRVNGTAEITGPIILDKSLYQYFVQVVAETYWNNGFRAGSAKVNSVSISYLGKETE